MENSSLLAIVSGYLIFIIVIWVLLVIANWKIFEKCGEKGWKALIPLYSDYIQVKLFWGNSIYFWIILISGVIYGAEIKYISGIFGVVDFILLACLCYKKSKAFGRGVGFTLGLMFLPNIFTFILGFGGYQYQGIPNKTNIERQFEDKVNDAFDTDTTNEKRYDNPSGEENIIDAEFTEKKDDKEE